MEGGGHHRRPHAVYSSARSRRRRRCPHMYVPHNSHTHTRARHTREERRPGSTLLPLSPSKPLAHLPLGKASAHRVEARFYQTCSNLNQCLYTVSRCDLLDYGRARCRITTPRAKNKRRFEVAQLIGEQQRP